jgi:GntR family transcriptional repressor for pyruvate dehydrogenase complex
MPIQPIQNRRLYQQIAEQLRSMIEADTFPPGSYLPPERELAAQFGVSRTSVREALIALEVVGLVSVRVGDGVSVRPRQKRGSKQDITAIAARQSGVLEVDPELGIELDLDVTIPPFSLLQARKLIEPEAAALAATQASDDQLAGIRDAFRRNQEDNRSGSTTHPGDRLFHIRIAEASGNDAYALMIKQLLAHKYDPMFQRLQTLYTPRDMPHRSEVEHRSILDALEARDAKAARRAMLTHLNSVIRIFSRSAQ